jgi:NADPH-dependent 2,4-dienoyl-CoA reductase/sulfur reductase-like enzyme
MTKSQKVVIVGASIAGLTVAESLRAEGFDGEILLIGEESHLPYSRPPLSKQVLLDGWDKDQTTLKTATELEELRIVFQGDTTAKSLNLKDKQLATSSGPVGYDILIIATGTKARRFDYLQNVLTLRTIEDALAIRRKINDANHLVVIGSGVLASEIASAGIKFGKKVTLVGRSKSLSFGSLGDALSSRIEKLHVEHGVNLRLQSKILDIESKGNQQTIKFEQGEDLVADLVVAAIGAIPCTDWLKDSGLTISNGIVCEQNGSAAPGVFAIGDVASWPDPFTGEPTRIEHQINAIEQAISVAASITENYVAKIPVPFFWSEIHGARIKAYGWFDSENLTELETDSAAGTLLVAQSKNKLSGVVSWDASPKEFMKARLLVDDYINLSTTNH